MKVYIYALGAVALAGIGSEAVAQGYYEYPSDRPIRWHIDAGYSSTTGRTADYLQGGWTIGTGFTLRPVRGSPFSIRTDLHYSQYNATNELIAIGEQQNQTQIDNGTGRIVGLDVDAVLDIPFSPYARGYLLAGVGGAYRRIDLTQTVAFGGYFCDPWYGFCGNGFFPGDVLVQREETTRFAWNAGFGVEFPLYNGQSWFVEARYNRMETDVPTEFIPIRVGLRF